MRIISVDNVIGHINDIEPYALEFDEESQLLTAKYMVSEIFHSESKSIYNDSSHVAIATVNGILHIVSFNFKHLVKDSYIDAFNGINFQNGYDHIIDITTPDKFIVLSEEE